MTKQRLVILENLKKITFHPTADEIYQLVRKQLPRISLGTVYRNLEVLSKCGLIKKLDVGGTLKRFDGKTKNHYHVRCICCNKVEDVPIEPIPELESAFRKVSKYEVLDHHLEFIGVCPQCKKNVKNSIPGEERKTTMVRKRNVAWIG